MKNPEFNYCIGIDASKKTLDLALVNRSDLNQCEQICILNNSKGLREIESWLQAQEIKLEDVLFCMEFTGIYNRPLQKYLEEHKAYLWMEMPIRIIRSMGLQRGKNDKIDAKRIALYAARHQEDKIKWQPATQEREAIRDLIGLRSRLITAKNMLLVPVKELETMGEKKRSLRVKNHSSKSVQSIENEIEKIEEEIRSLIKKEPSMQQNINLIMTIPGVGQWTALQMVCVTDNFQRLNTAKQLACYCGCAPFEHRSGTSVRGRSRVSHMANKTMKVLLTMGAVSIIKSKNEMSCYYERKVAEGKNKMSVINAVRNKIIQRVIAVVERQTPYIVNVTANC